ncbi:MAG TPA: Reverse transcriptase [Desulfovibrio sp.]|jgi:hypothetical protein|nr:Reverse transcriptase [Desulfovibrio sp.]
MRDKISLTDVGIAYRKAKADIFYSSRQRLKELCLYESSIKENLAELQRLVNEDKSPHIPANSWTLVPKKIENDSHELNFTTSDPEFMWDRIKHAAKNQDKKINAEFRIMEALPVDFHVFSSIWINMVGHKFEEKLTDSARGNRLRRDKNKRINPLSLGTTTPYLYPYCKWRDDALATIGKELELNKSIVTITADGRSFYHNIDARFMLDKNFIDSIGVKLNNKERILHKNFINSLHAWANDTPLKRGLPVGLTASSVIANAALFEFDKLVTQEVSPLYYGRYVDDIIIVMENTSNFKEPTAVWDWIIDRMQGALSWDDNAKKCTLKYSQKYLHRSNIEFSDSKGKTYFLSGKNGLHILQSIKHAVMSRTSEWRAFPSLPIQPDTLESSLISTIQNGGTPAHSLQKGDNSSTIRARFALKLRDIESYSRALPPDAWQPTRHAFLNAFIQHMLILPKFFEFYNYIKRVISLATHCGDFEHLRQILNALHTALKELNACNCSINAAEEYVRKKDIMHNFKENIISEIRDSIISSFPTTLTSKSKKSWEGIFTSSHNLFKIKEVSSIIEVHRSYIKCDLAYRPLKQYILPPYFSGNKQRQISRKDLLNQKTTDIAHLLPDSAIEGCKALANALNTSYSKSIPSGIAFPVRPLNLHDIYIAHNDPFSPSGRKSIAKALVAMRGFNPEDHLPLRNKKNIVSITTTDDKQKAVSIAIASWQTKPSSWLASVSRHPDPDTRRWDRFNHLLNQILKSPIAPHYLILPELSVPAHWFLGAIGKLSSKGISFISGIEYLHRNINTVHNQVWAALPHDALGFPTSLIYRQDKQRAALHEEHELWRVAKKTLKPEMQPWTTPPIVKHGNFYFSILICSELTNIKYRSELRGKIDALFIPEWNKDTDTFTSLVESAALDIHTYVIQCNDRQYGDSRIRSPHKESWMRDIVRVKGGIEDYFVIGEIYPQALRAFQSAARSPMGPFKPAPDGFKISRSRKILPSPDAL